MIRVKPGLYPERVYVQRERGRIAVVGDDPATTILQAAVYADQLGADGRPLGTFRTPTLQIDGDGFVLENITVQNAAGPVGQALAVRIDGDRVVLRRCRLLGWQDTLLVNRGRQYLEDCYIEGHVDFIFGGATTYFNRGEVHALRDGYLTAASTPAGAAYGFVFADGKVTGEAGVQTYLGRPWRGYARTGFLRTAMSGVVRPAGWHNWNKPNAEQTAFYAEFGSTGAGARLADRVAWAHPLTADEAATYTVATVLAGADGWDPRRGN